MRGVLRGLDLDGRQALHLVINRSKVPLGFELRADGAQRLHGPDHQIAVALHPLLNSLEKRSPIALIEINGHVAAEDDIKAAERSEVFHQVQLSEAGHGPDLVANFPTFGVRDKRPVPDLAGQAALYLNLAEYAFTRPRHGLI